MDFSGRSSSGRGVSQSRGGQQEAIDIFPKGFDPECSNFIREEVEIQEDLAEEGACPSAEGKRRTDQRF